MSKWSYTNYSLCGFSTLNLQVLLVKIKLFSDKEKWACIRVGVLTGNNMIYCFT